MHTIPSLSKLGQLCNELVLSTEDYFELLFNYIQATASSLSLMGTFIRLIESTEKIFTELESDWTDKFRNRLEEGHPINSMLFTGKKVFLF